MKIEIRKFTQDLKESWDGFVRSSINGTFLHSRNFFDHNPLNERDDCSFLFYKKNKLSAVIPFTEYQENDRRILHSHARATYGGFVVSEEIGTEEAVEMVAQVIEEGKSIDASEIIIRNPFRIFHKELCDETDFAMWYHGFTIKSRELEIAINLKGDIETIRKRYDNGTKYNIKKAIKQVKSVISTDWESFWLILEQNLLEKHGKKPVHSLTDIHNLKNKVGEEFVKLFAGFIDNKMVCGVLVFVSNTKSLHAQYIGSDPEFQEIRPLNAVIDYIIEWGNKQGFEYFNEGTANAEGGREINYGLFHFKEGFGGRATLRETMTLNLKSYS